MKPSTKKYPDNLIGTYTFNFSELYLMPTDLQPSNSDCYALSCLAIRDGKGIALFSDQTMEVLKMSYDQSSNVYTFWYNMIEHSFQIRANISGLCRSIEIQANYAPQIAMAIDLNS